MTEKVPYVELMWIGIPDIVNKENIVMTLFVLATFDMVVVRIIFPFY